MEFNFSEFMERLANDMGGQYSEYDNSKSVIIVPLPDNRYQAVVGTVKYNDKFNKTGVEFSSKVCALMEEIDIKELLMENAKTYYAKFVIIDDYQSCYGCKRAVDEFIRDRNLHPDIKFDGRGGCYFIKT